MRFERLRIQGLRCLSEVEVDLGPGINVFEGPNGAGKTSMLEAAFLLSHARSFRSGARDALLQRGASELAVFAELMHGDGRSRRVGLGRAGSPRWDARIDGEKAALGALVGECAVVCFEPGSHALIAGAADERRRYLDWGVFHVEQGFLETWRRYQRALKQRNALLRSAASADELFSPWEAELAQAAHTIEAQRQRYLEQLTPMLAKSAGNLLPELGVVELRYRRGWPEGSDLADVLGESRARDRLRGHTTVGAHRADWALAFTHAPLREHLSRGQEKLAALASLLAQAALFAAERGEWPVVCLDDLASELDHPHQQALVAELQAAGAQVLLTGTELPPALAAVPHRLFHVEQGQVARLL
ncbi:DNA replication/repair protein RecF [Rhodanobacter caeni]|uniref:DNA replication and repair protein RecF n=1 Tax=Rhodanobacter caeni TaxID=657654 RepID=A0ABN0UED6_9GAMM